MAPTPTGVVTAEAGADALAPDASDFLPPVIPGIDTQVGGKLGRFWAYWTIVHDPLVIIIIRQGYSSLSPPRQAQLLFQTIQLLVLK